MKFVKWYLFFLIITCLFYGTSLRYGFSQDDWYFLYISQAHSIGDIFNFFNPWTQAGFAFFRPLGTQLYYYLFSSPFSMHLFMLSLQALNGYLVTRLLLKLRYSKLTSYLVGILYSLSSVHFLSLYYIAATQQLLAASFSLFSLLFFLQRKYFVTGIFFLLALFSKETAIVTPAVAYLLSDQKVFSRLRSLIPYIVVGAAYGLLRLLSTASTQSEYHFFFGPSIITNLRWYALFASNFPEGLVNYGLPRMGINFYKFAIDAGWTLVLLPSVLSIYAFYKLLATRNWKLVIWFTIALSPVILLRNHLYPHYLDLGLVPFLILLIDRTPAKLRWVIFTIFIISSYLSIHYSVKNHWTTNRATMSTALLARLPWSELCQKQAIAFVGDVRSAREVSYTLSLANGPRVICQNRSLAVYYEGIDPEIPSNVTSVDITWVK